jgi:hypothetical protein
VPRFSLELFVQCNVTWLSVSSTRELWCNGVFPAYTLSCHVIHTITNKRHSVSMTRG